MVEGDLIEAPLGEEILARQNRNEAAHEVAKGAANHVAPGPFLQVTLELL